MDGEVGDIVRDAIAKRTHAHEEDWKWFRYQSFQAAYVRDLRRFKIRSVPAISCSDSARSLSISYRSFTRLATHIVKPGKPLAMCRPENCTSAEILRLSNHCWSGY